MKMTDEWVSVGTVVASAVATLSMGIRYYDAAEISPWKDAKDI